MSDISIPGVTNKYNTTETIEGIIRLERIPVQRMEEEVKQYELQRQTWRDMNVGLSKVRDAAKSLYGFQNSFGARIAKSSDERYLTGTASREAAEGISEIEILSKATSDHFLSASLDEDIQILAGNYGFQVGDEELSIRFRGGKLSAFVDTLNRRSRGLLEASVIRDTADTAVLSIKTRKTGRANRLFFEENSEELALKLGLLKETAQKTFSFTPEMGDLRAWKTPLNPHLFRQGEEGLTLLPGAEGKIPISLSPEQGKELSLEFRVRVRTLTDAEENLPQRPPGPQIPATGEITFENLTLRSASSQVELPEWSPPPRPSKNEDGGVFSLGQGGQTLALEALSQGDSSRMFQIPLKDMADGLESFNFHNRNTHREVEISDIRIYNPEARGDREPANPISLASDARLTIDGIPISRGSNSIDDLIPGVTVNLKRPTSEPLKLTVGPDREAIKDKVITLVGHYNSIMANINILTNLNPAVIEQLDYYTDDEKEEAQKKLGLYQGDSTLRHLKNRLQRIMMDPYPTEADTKMRLLVQTGISTGSRIGSDVAGIRRRGYLEIDEKVLDKALEDHVEAVKELFGRDSDEDLIVDTGAAFALDNYIKSYVETGGIIAYKTLTLEGRIEETTEDIADYNLRLEDREAKLKAQYGAMEGALEAMQRNSQALDNFSNSSKR